MKSVLNCISKLTLKIRIKTPIIFHIKKSEFILKIKNKILPKDVLESDFKNYSKSVLTFKIKNKDVKDNMEFLIKFNDNKKFLKNFNIKDEFVIKNIDILERVTKVHITNYSNKNSEYISKVKDIIYIILGYHQFKISSVDKYKSMKAEEVITEEVMKRIKYL